MCQIKATPADPKAPALGGCKASSWPILFSSPGKPSDMRSPCGRAELAFLEGLKESPVETKKPRIFILGF